MVSLTCLFRVYWLSLIILTNACNATQTINNTTHIICSAQHDCSVSCSQNDCDHRTIRCPSDNLHRCRIICNNAQSCQNTIILAKNATTLDLICDSIHSCSGITVHCPVSASTNHQNQNIKTCVVQINHNTNSNIAIYSHNGWQSIKLLNYTALNTQFSGTIFCQSNNQCLFDLAQSSQCINNDNECNGLYTPNTTQIYSQTTYFPETQKPSFWSLLSRIYFLWWVIFALIASTLCLISVLLFYMRIQYKYTKELSQQNRIGQFVAAASNSSLAQKRHTSLATNKMNKMTARSFSQEISSKTSTHIPLQAASSNIPSLKKAISVPVPGKAVANTNNVHFPQYADLEMTRNPSYNSSAKTLTFKQRKESIHSHTNDMEALSVVSGSSINTKASMNTFYYTANNSMSQIVYTAPHRNSSTQYAAYNHQRQRQRQQSCPQLEAHYVSYPTMQRHPLAPIMPHGHKQQSYSNGTEVNEQKMAPEIMRINKNLQSALEHLADTEEIEEKNEVVNEVWTDATMLDGKVVLSLHNQPSSGILGMLPDVVGNNKHIDDSD